MVSITKKNHINPCLWMAIWNKEYYENFVKGEKTASVRDQIVNFLEINSNKHLVDKVENIHYEKHLGIAKLEKDKVLDFCKRHHPDKLDEITKELENDEGKYIIDFENIFSGLEKIPLYSSVLDVVKSGRVEDDQQKAWLSTFLTHHVLRTPQYLNTLIEHNKKNGVEKFETLITLKWSLGGTLFLTPEIIAVYQKQWTIYKLDKMSLPLSDFPIVATPSHIFSPLGPDLLLAVSTKSARGLGINYESRIPPDLYKLYMRTTINKANKGLVFSDEEYLRKCQETVWWYKRRKYLGLT